MRREVLGATILSLCDIAAKVVGFIMLPYLANKMGTLEYGRLTLYTSATNILVIVISLSGQGLIPVRYIQYGATDALNYRASTLKLSLSITLLLSALALTLPLFTTESIVDPLLTIILSLFQAINIVNLSYLRISQTYTLASFGQASVVLLNALGTFLLFWAYGASTTSRLIAIAFSFFAPIVIYYSAFKGGTASASNSEITKYGLSLLPHHLSYWIKSSADRFVIAHAVGVGMAGIYGLAVNLASIMIIGFTVINQACQPFIYRLLKSRKASKVIIGELTFSALVTVAAVMLFFLAPIVFPLLFNPEYSAAIDLFRILIIGSAFHALYMVYTHVLFYREKTKTISLISLLSMGMHVSGLFWITLKSNPSVINFCYVYSASTAMSTILTVTANWLEKKGMAKELSDASTSA